MNRVAYIVYMNVTDDSPFMHNAKRGRRWLSALLSRTFPEADSYVILAPQGLQPLLDYEPKGNKR